MADVIGDLFEELKNTAGAKLAVGLLILRWALRIVGPVFLLVAVVAGGRTAAFLRSSVAETGTVVSNVRVDTRPADGGDATTSFAPEFTFTGVDGKSYTVTSSTSSDPPAFAEGQTVRVLYDPRDPGSARIDTFGQIWGLAVGFGIAGLACFALGGVWMVWKVRRDQKMLSIAG